MTWLPLYQNSIQTFSVFLAPVFSAFFLLWIIIFKTAAREDAYSQVNRIHFNIGLTYVATLIGLAVYLKQFDLFFLIGLFVGSYIYFSLHYVFIFPLIGICKKSISINILESIFRIDQTVSPCSKAALADHMAHRNAGIADIRQNRLEQMVLLKFATTQDNLYRITPFGKRVHELSEILLGIWHQKRL